MDKTNTSLAQASIELSKALDLRLDTLHIKWLETFDKPWQRRLQLSPRGHGKSTVWGVLGVLSTIVLEQSSRVLIVSKTETLASRLLRQIGYYAKRLNEAGMIPELKTFNNTELRLKGVESKEPNVTAVGVLGSITGMHFDIMIGDDILDDRNTQRASQREAVWEWFTGSLLQLALPHTRTLLIGTRKHPEDLYGKLIADPAWDSQVESAVLKWPDNFERAFSQGDPIEQFFTFGENGEVLAIKKEGDWEVLWPESWDIDRLLLDRLMSGQVMFDREKQNDVSFYCGHIFKREWITYYEEKPPREGLNVYIACDLAISQNSSADYFALVVAGMDIDGMWYLLDIYKGHIGFSKQLEVISEKTAYWQPLIVGIESISYQKSLLDSLQREGFVPAIGIHNSAPKESRIRSLQPMFEQGRIKISEDHEAFVQELLDFPGGEHDDMIDALEMAISLGRRSLGPRVDILDSTVKLD